MSDYQSKTPYCVVDLSVYLAGLQQKLQDAEERYNAAKQRYEDKSAQENPHVEEAKRSLKQLLELANTYWAKNLTGKFMGNVPAPQDRIGENLLIRMHKKNYDAVGDSVSHSLFNYRRHGDQVTIYIEKNSMRNSAPTTYQFGVDNLKQVIKSYQDIKANKVKLSINEAEGLGIKSSEFLDSWYE